MRKFLIVAVACPLDHAAGPAPALGGPAESRRSDGTWVRYRWNEGGAAVSESVGHGEHEAFSLTYERDATSQVVTALTLTCPDRRGQPLRHTSIVSDGNEDAIKRGLLETHCSWRRYTSAGQAGRSEPDGK